MIALLQSPDVGQSHQNWGLEGCRARHPWSGPIIAARTGITTVYDFRRADLALGGEGAPLVPYVDLLLLGDRQSLAVQNLGGIGNVTVIQRGRGRAGLFAFDTGPANLLIDRAPSSQRWPAALLDGRAYGDRHNQRAPHRTAGTRTARRPPKSTGREEPAGRADALIARGRALGLGDADLAATATAFTARSIADAYRRFVWPITALDAVLLCGGGARNPTLRRMLAAALAPLPVGDTDDHGLPASAKEAIAFAVLAYETAYGRPGALPTTTGAQRPPVLGSIAPGRGFRLWSGSNDGDDS
jgi:anhydro-N-acetylmuramic acid kinase